MLKNIFNCSGIGKKTHIVRVEHDVIYYGSSSNIIKYENDKITPIIRNRQEIIALEVRDGIILCDSQFNVEMNNEFVYCSKSAVTAVSKTKRIYTENGNVLDFYIFSTLSNIFIVSEKEIFSIECKNIVSIDCAIKNEYLLVLLGSLEGNLIKIIIDYENMMIAKKNVFSAGQKLNDYARVNYCTLFDEEKILKKIENVTRLQKYRLNTFRIHDDTITDIKIAEKFIITSSQDNTIKLFDSSTFEQIDTLLGHADIVYECYYDRRNDQIISAGGDNCVIVWKNANGWKIETKIGKLANLPFFSAVQIEQEKKFIIYVQGYNGGIYKYIDFNLVESTSGHCDKINSLDVRNDLILTGSSDFSSRLYKKMVEIARPCLQGHSIKNAIFAGDMVVVGSEETIIRIFEETTAIKYLGNKLFDREEKLNIATPSELSLTNEIRNVEKIEVNEHNLQNILCFREKKKIYAQFFANSALAANNEIIVCSNKSANLKFSGIFLIRNSKAVQYIAVHDLGIEKIEISPNGKYVVAVSRDKCASVYSVNDKFEEIVDQSLKYQNKKLEESDKYIKFIRKEQIHQRTINTVCFHSDNEIFITASKDRTINFISLHSLENIKTIKLEKEPTALRYHNNILIVGFIDGTVSIFSAKYEKKFCGKIHGQKINEIKCMQNNIITIGDDWLLRVFELDIK